MTTAIFKLTVCFRDWGHMTTNVIYVLSMPSTKYPMCKLLCIYSHIDLCLQCTCMSQSCLFTRNTPFSLLLHVFFQFSLSIGLSCADPKIFEGGGGRSKDNFVCLKCGVGMAGRRPSFKNIMWKFDFFQVGCGCNPAWLWEVVQNSNVTQASLFHCRPFLHHARFVQRLKSLC